MVNGLVIDIRFNGGGYDSVSLAIANHFADKKWHVVNNSG